MNTELQNPSAKETYILNTESHKPSAAFLGASWAGVWRLAATTFPEGSSQAVPVWLA